MAVKRGKAQTWSLDLVLAVSIFILILIVFYTVLSSPSRNKQDDLKQAAQQISNRLGTETGDTRATIIFDGKVNETKLTSLSTDDYQDLKRILGTSKDFCIYLEDENNRIVPINGSQIGIGSDSITVDGKSCNATIS